jgi:hypothetical protein
MHQTRGASVQRPLTCGPSGWPAGQTPWPIGPTLQLPMSFLGHDALQEVVEWTLRPRVGGGHAPWPDGHVARPVGEHLASYRLNQVSNCSWDSYKYPPADGMDTHHTLLVVLHL